MAARPDLYAVLGVPRNATTAELTKAYRQRARITHPDAGGDPLAFRAVSRAWEVLSDVGLRAGYDAELDGETGAAAGPAQATRPDAAKKAPEAGPSAAPPHCPGSTTAGRPAPGRRPTSHRSAPAHPVAGSTSGVDLGQIRWAEPFLDLEGPALHPDRVRVVPGLSRLVVRVVLWVATIAWCAAGVWIGGHRLPRVEGDSPLWIFWVLGWWLAALVVGVQVLRRRIPLMVVICAVLAWPAYNEPRAPWSWVVFAWLAGAVALPLLLAGSSRPVWPRRRVWAGNVFGEPSWAGQATEPLVCDLLVIPAARLLHQVAGAEHAVVLDRRVALVADGQISPIGGCDVRVWPSQIVDDPVRAVEEIGRWLLDGTDGWTVDRAALAAVQP